MNTATTASSLSYCSVCNAWYVTEQGHVCGTHASKASLIPAYGWECPRCHTINAPWSAQCTCKQGDEYRSMAEQEAPYVAIGDNDEGMPNFRTHEEVVAWVKKAMLKGGV